MSNYSLLNKMKTKTWFKLTVILSLLGIIVLIYSTFVSRTSSHYEYFNSNMQIPKLVHYVYLYKEPQEFNLVYALSILSSLSIIKPTDIFFWYETEPYGKWWDIVKPHLNMQYVKSPENIGSKPLRKGAHKADIVRMQKLLEYGGIYLDMDTICVRSIDDMLQYSMVMGMEGDYGLCNAIIMANKHSPFLQEWWNEYENAFNPDGWNEASVQLPRKLALTNNNIMIYPENTFFKPSFNETEKIFITPTNEIPPELRILHLWDSNSKQYYTFNSIEEIKHSQSLYGNIIRHLFKTTNINEFI